MMKGATTVQAKRIALATLSIATWNGFPVSPRSLFVATVVAWLMIWVAPLRPLLAQANEPVVSYDITNNTIIVGAAYRPSNPAEAAFVGNPSHPDAPKFVLTIPQLAGRLALLGQPTLLVPQENNIWLLKANLTIEQNARVEATLTTINGLRIESTAPQPANVVSSADVLAADFGLIATEIISPVNYLKVLVNGGTLIIKGIGVSSWDTPANGVDSNVKDGRSYIAAQRGARLDVLNADVSYLGWTKREGTGLSWRTRASATLPESATTGAIYASNIHHNYYGLYLFDSNIMRIEENQVSDNIYYGMLASRCTDLVISGNEFFNNRGHGLLLSRQCNRSTISGNQLHHNGWSGLALYRSADNNQIFDNLIFANNKSGIIIFQSSGNQIYENKLSNNQQSGITLNAIYDPADTVDALATDNVVNYNTIDASQLGICLYGRADRNMVTKNSITGQATAGIAVFTGGNQVVDNEVYNNGWGILVEGGEPLLFDKGVVEPLAALDTPGHANRLAGNTIEQNIQGIVIHNGADNVVGGLIELPEVADDAGNKIRLNLEHGIYLSATHDTLIAHNIITDNALTGLTIIGEGSERNRLTRNRITANGQAGIVLSAETNPRPAPTITRYGDGIVQGIAMPGSLVELYRDPQGQGRYYLGAALANDAGSWTVAISETLSSKQGEFTALATDTTGNTSEFSAPFSATDEVPGSLLAAAGRNETMRTLTSANGIDQSSVTRVQQECLSDLPELAEGSREDSGEIAMRPFIWLPFISK